MSKRIDPKVLQLAVGSGYPAPFHEPCAERTRQRLANAAGLTDFGVNSLHLPPGTWSSQRHWHTEEDEFVFVVEGEVVLVSDSGEEVLGKGDCAGFKAGVRDGHHLQNRSMGMPWCSRSVPASPRTRASIRISTCDSPYPRR
jgi:uncharacterized cupin superfamily protein